MPSVATPRARPLCCRVISTPLPMPARWAGTSARTMRKSPANSIDWPAPAMASGIAMDSSVTCGQSQQDGDEQRQADQLRHRAGGERARGRSG